MPSIHHRFGPSTLGHLAICPGWLNDNTVTHAKADEGTLMHKAAETGDLSILLNDEQKKMVQMCLDYVAPREAFAQKVYKEESLPILRGLIFGTADRIIQTRTTKGVVLDVVDFKFGLWPVEDAEYNLQGYAYVLGAFDLVPEATEVTVHFLCPRQDVVSTHTFSRQKDCVRLSMLVKKVIDAAYQFENTQDPKLLRPTQEGCLFCARKASCPHMTKFAVEVAHKYEGLEVPAELHSSKITDPGQMAKLMDTARVLEKIATSIKTHAMSLALENSGLYDEHGNLVYEIAERAGSRSIKDLGLAMPVLSEYLTDREILSCADVSLPKLMSLISQKAPNRQKGKTVAEVEAKLQDADAIRSTESGTRYLRRAKATKVAYSTDIPIDTPLDIPIDL